jgi:DNA adenine methylase
MNKLRPVLKTHGGKYYLKDFIIQHFPKDYENLTYFEPCCGGCSVILNKKTSTQEIINDSDPKVVAVLKALRDEPKEFISRLKKIKYTEVNFEKAQNQLEFEDYIDEGINEYVLRRMSRGGMKKAFAWSERQRGNKPGDENAWETMLQELPKLAERLKDVHILNNTFQKLLKIWDDPNTFMYLDPPYLPTTRAKGATKVYDNEMNLDDHITMLSFIKDARSKVMISGYSSSLYNKFLKGWKVVKKEVVNHSSQQKTKEKRCEILWMNYH